MPREHEERRVGSNPLRAASGEREKENERAEEDREGGGERMSHRRGRKKKEEGERVRKRRIEEYCPKKRVRAAQRKSARGEKRRERSGIARAGCKKKIEAPFPNRAGVRDREGSPGIAKAYPVHFALP